MNSVSPKPEIIVLPDIKPCDSQNLQKLNAVILYLNTSQKPLLVQWP